MAIAVEAVILILSTTLLSAVAKPSCKFYGVLQKDLICKAGNTDYVLVRGLVSDNNRTTGITLRSCRLTDIDFEAFENLSALTYLDLAENKIKELKLGVLDDAHHVTYLNLSHNALTGFPLGLFDQKPNLIVLDLKANKINSLVLGIFDHLSKLEHLDLSSNDLKGKDLDPYLFDCSPHIRFMDFSRNDMSDAPDLLLHAFQNLDFLNLDRCSLTELPNFVTAANLITMKHLMLSTNQISKLGDPIAFTKLENLEKLNLAYNVIENVNENVFKPLKKLTMIVLRSNKLKHLPDTLFQNLDKLNTIDLSHNLIEFVPVNAFRGTMLRNLNLADNRFTYLTNNFCLELRNSGARLTKFFFNQNPWQCACLKQMLNEVIPMGVEYNSVKYNGKEIVCVTTSEFYCKRHQIFNELYSEMYYNMVK